MKYLNREYISPEAIWAEVKLTLKSYFESGALDDSLFPIWTEHCIKKFRRAAFPIKEIYLRIENYSACLPEDFKFVKEAWICGEVFTQEYSNGASCYYQTDCIIGESNPDPCTPCDDICAGQSRKVFHKVNRTEVFTYTFSHLLSPGTVNTRSKCDNSCPNLTSNCPDKFDVVDGKFMTNLEQAGVHLSYYGDYYSEEGLPLIEDNDKMVNYIFLHLMYKCMEMLFHNQTDDTFNQISSKLALYKQQTDEAYIIASIESKKETIAQRTSAIYRRRNRYNEYILQNDLNYRNGRSK